MRTWAFLLATALLAGCTQDTDPIDGTDDATPTEAGEAPAVQAITWGGDEAPLRPGSSLGGYCTFNFLFEGLDGTAYIGTAGHCTDEIGERVELAGYGEVGAVVFDSDLTDVFPDVDEAVDFSLIRLDADVVADADPRMLGYDGPVGAIDAGDLAVGDLVQLHGYGLVLGMNDYTRDRQGALVDWDEDLYRVDMPAVNGDSGSPLLHAATGKAFGIVSHYGIGAVPPSTDEGPLMPFILEQLEVAGFQVALATV